MRHDHLLEMINAVALFGYAQCDIKVPEHLREKFVEFQPIFKKTNICRQDIGHLMQHYAEKEGLMTQPRRKRISSFELTSDRINTSSLLFYLELGFVCTRVYCFVEYTPAKRFNNFLQSALNDRRQGDENPNSKLYAETKNLLANSQYGDAIIDPSCFSVTRYMNDEKTHAVINNK